MDNSWVFKTQTKIYSRLNAVCTAKLIKDYPDINITMDDHAPTKAKFPNVYVHFLPSVELGADLEGQDVNAIYCTVQIEVTVTNGQGITVANKVSQVVVDCMKEMRFNATLPEFTNSDSIYRTVSRFTRTIGKDDTLYTV